MDKNKIKKVIVIILLFLIIPIVTGVIVSVPSFSNLKTNNDWIGFWGSYFGAVLGGVITLLVMRTTLMNSKDMQHRDQKRQLCDHIAELSSEFCIELMAYRSKWNMLYKQAQGENINMEKKIEVGATTEKPRRIMFEMEILLYDIDNANDCLQYMKYLLDEAKLTKQSLKDTEALLNDYREKIRIFIHEYMA